MTFRNISSGLFLLATLGLTVPVGLVGCDEDTSEEIEEAAEETGEAMEEAAEDVKDAAEDAADKVEDAVDDAN